MQKNEPHPIQEATIAPRVPPVATFWGIRTEGALQAGCLLLPGYLSILSRWMLSSLFLLCSLFLQGQSLSMVLLDAASPLIA